MKNTTQIKIYYQKSHGTIFLDVKYFKKLHLQ